jgi:hypothetical protein
MKMLKELLEDEERIKKLHELVKQS